MIFYKSQEKKKIIKHSLITERDVSILNFINNFGFCELTQVMKQFSVQESNAYKLMKRLMGKDLLIHDRIFHGQKGIYRLTNDGASFTDLPALEKVPIHQYRHQLTIIEVYIQLSKQYPDVYWLSERFLIKDQTQQDIKEKKHVADGLLIFPDGRQIAIEVELNLKSKKRLAQIFKSYGSQFLIDEVWYFCPSHLVSTLKQLAEKRPFIKIRSLSELNEQFIR